MYLLFFLTMALFWHSFSALAETAESLPDQPYEPVEYSNTSVSELGAHTSKKTAEQVSTLRAQHDKEPD